MNIHISNLIKSKFGTTCTNDSKSSSLAESEEGWLELDDSYSRLFVFLSRLQKNENKKQKDDKFATKKNGH